MIFRQLNPGLCRTYLIGSERTREVVLVDPLAGRAEAVLEELRAEGLKLRWVIDTRTHCDHASGAARIRERTGVDYLMHFSTEVACVSKRLRERDVIGLGEVTLSFLHVPGQARDGLLVLLPDRFLSGDFLLIGPAGAGRLDLPGADARIHFRSLAKLASVPEDMPMYPAHAEPGTDHTTLAAERKTNPVLKARGLEDYLRFWEGAALEPADWRRAVTDANLGCSREPPSTPEPSLAAVSAAARAKKGK